MSYLKLKETRIAFVAESILILPGRRRAGRPSATHAQYCAYVIKYYMYADIVHVGLGRAVQYLKEAFVARARPTPAPTPRRAPYCSCAHARTTYYVRT